MGGYEGAGLTNAEHGTTNQGGISQVIKVNCPLPATDRAAGVVAENLWAEVLGSDRFRIDNVPFYAYGVSLGDVVRADEIDGRLVFRDVVARSGHSTYRVLVKDRAGADSAGFQSLWRGLGDLGCA